MSSGLKLLIEEPTYELETYELETVVEEKNLSSPSVMYIKGPFLMASTRNKNGRIYRLDEMKKEVDRYLLEMVKTNRALGELNHPASVEINPERACHMVTELFQKDNIFYGKSKILSNPMGQLVRSLISDGVRLGVSSRALGKLTEKGENKDFTDFRLLCCDIVHDPSVEMAFVDGIFEAKEWVLKCNGSVCEFVEQTYTKLEDKLSTLPKHDVDTYIRESIVEFIKSLKNC